MRRAGILFLALAAGGSNATADPVPRTLVLALDGVPYRVVAEARARGHFADWSASSRMIAPFPSLTNVSFTMILDSFGVEPAPGYEFQHFDRDQNRVHGMSPFHYRENSFAWRDAFDSVGRSLGSKLAVYTIPWKKSKKELAAAERVLLESPHELILAHVGSTDALQHLRGDKETLKLVGELDSWIAGLRERHERQTGRPLRVVMLSDHGNTSGKVRGIDGVRRRLRRAGLHVTKRLGEEDGVVAATFGLVGYGSLFLDPKNAERAARAVVDHPQIDLAVWLASPSEMRVVGAEGAAVVRWLGEGDRRYAYEDLSGDPLRLRAAARRLAAKGELDRDGFASDDDWLRETALGLYPDAMHRLVDALAGAYVMNRATVIFSVRPGYSWGLKSARWASWLRGGRIEGTHGGLDGESSFGFVMSTDPGVVRDPSVRAEHVLDGLAAEWLRAEGAIAD